MTKPIAVTMGDPSGIGSELIQKMVLARADAELIIFGDQNLFHKIENLNLINDFSNLKPGVNLFHIPCAHNPIPAQPHPENSPAIIHSIERAVNAVKSGVASALLTAPIHKANLAKGVSFNHPGHTEFLAHLDQADHAVMMLTAEGILRVVPATIHCALSEVSSRLSAKTLEKTIEIIDRDLTKYLGHRPKIAIAGLNPHAGENGRIGSEEIEWIKPLIDKLSTSYQLKGPYAADTMFHEKARQSYDLALCMYHDQALIPIKTLAFDKGVNVTLGLSFLRASPDHGTAYDIAGKGIANPSSMIAAYDLLERWCA